jgi:hypothetical protein
VSLQLHYTGSLKSMDSAKYFQNGLAELIEIWHTAKVFKFYHLIVFSIFNVIYFKDARLTCFFLNGTGDLNVIFLERVFFVNSVM